MSHPAHAAVLDGLRERIRHIEAPVRHGVLPFGIAAIDGGLPGGGLRLGAVHEVAGAGADEEDGAAAAGFVAGILARLGFIFPPTSPFRRAGMSSPPKDGEDWGEAWDSRALASDPVLWCLRQPDLYGPGLLAHGLDPARLVMVAGRRDDEILWTAEEGLRAGSGSGLVAVVAEIERLPVVAGRRLQLAAERSGITAFLLRRWRSGNEAAAERARPSAALTRWRIAALPSMLNLSPYEHPLPHWGRGGETSGGESRGKWGLGMGRSRWRVDLLRCRGGVSGSWDVEVADAAGRMRLSAGLADRPAAPARRHGEPLRRTG